MAYTDLEKLAAQVQEDLEGFFQSRRVKLRESLSRLLELLMTTRIPEALAELAGSGEVRGLRTHLKALESYLRENSYIPEAFCSRYKYKISESQARSRYKVSKGAWGYVHRLAKDVGWDPALNVPLIPYEKYRWHDALEERFVNVEVVLDTHALEGMLVSAMEGYLSPRRTKRKGYEVYGINLGMTRDVQRGRTPDGSRMTRYVSVMRSQPQLSADAEYQFVEPNPRSLDAILTTTQALYPQYQAVGHFHSHPYDEFSDLEEKKGWVYSPSDEQINIDFARVMADLHQRIMVTFVVGISRSGQTVTRSHFKGLKNTIQMSIANCRVIIAAYRSLGSGRLARSNIRLALSGMVS